MRERRLFELAAFSLGIGFAAGLPLGWRLRWLHEAGGLRGLEKDPLAVWLPVALVGALATYVVVVAILAPRRFLVGVSILLLAMAGFLVLVHQIFGEAGSVVNQILTPFVIHLVALGCFLTVVRTRGIRLINVAANADLPRRAEWRYGISELLLLTTAVAVFLSVVHQFDYFWRDGSGRFQRFLWTIGICVAVLSVATVWATLGKRWRWWAPIALALAPMGAAAGWYARNSLLYPFYWYGIFTALHAGFLMLMLSALRLNGFQLRKIPAPVAEFAQVALPRAKVKK